MRVVFSPLHAKHAPEFETESGVPVPIYEKPERADLIRAVLQSDGGFEFVEPEDHGRGPIDAVHDERLVDYLANPWPHSPQDRERSIIPDTMAHFALRQGMGDGPEPYSLPARRGYFCFDTTTPIVEGTYVAARAAVDVALTATDTVLSGERAAYGLCRPPGHHAARSVYGGYCYFNNAAVAAEHAVSQTSERVAVLDVDYHHGNGTQQIFYARDDVLYISLHAHPDRAYPYFTGFEDERGTGSGEGANLNFPLPAGCDWPRFFDALRQGLETVAAFHPAVTIVSLGVDTIRGDPISDFSLMARDQHEMGLLVAEVCPRMVVLQEGGYLIDTLGANVLAWLRGCEGRTHVESGSDAALDTRHNA